MWKYDGNEWPPFAIDPRDWSSPDPLPDFEDIAGYLAYPARHECTVDGVPVAPGR